MCADRKPILGRLCLLAIPHQGWVYAQRLGNPAGTQYTYILTSANYAGKRIFPSWSYQARLTVHRSGESAPFPTLDPDPGPLVTLADDPHIPIIQEIPYGFAVPGFAQILPAALLVSRRFTYKSDFGCNDSLQSGRVRSSLMTSGRFKVSANAVGPRKLKHMFQSGGTCISLDNTLQSPYQLQLCNITLRSLDIEHRLRCPNLANCVHHVLPFPRIEAASTMAASFAAPARTSASFSRCSSVEPTLNCIPRGESAIPSSRSAKSTCSIAASRFLCARLAACLSSR